MAATAATALALGSTASAAVTSAGGFTYVTKRYAPPADVVRTLAAPCPEGTDVYGGGHYNDGGFAEAIPRHSYPYDGGDRDRKPDDGWKVQTSVDPGVSVSVYAICAGPAPRYEQEAFTAGAQRQRTNSIACDQGLEVVSGGTRGHPDVVEASSFPNSNLDWFAAVDNYTLQDKQTTALLICTARRASFDFGSTSSDVVQPRSQEGDDASCPNRTHVVGGGVMTTGGYRDNVIAASRPSGFGGSAVDGWRGWVDNHDANSAQDFFTVPICAQPIG